MTRNVMVPLGCLILLVSMSNRSSGAIQESFPPTAGQSGQTVGSGVPQVPPPRSFQINDLRSSRQRFNEPPEQQTNDGTASLGEWQSQPSQRPSEFSSSRKFQGPQFQTPTPPERDDLESVISDRQLLPNSRGLEPLGSNSNLPPAAAVRFSGVAGGDAATAIVDPQVATANFETLDPMNPSAVSAPSGSDPNALLERYRLTQYREPLPGVPLTVEAALAQTPPQIRTEMVRQYWSTFAAWCRYMQAIEQRAATSRLSSVGGGDASLVQGALALADFAVQRTEDELVEQQRLLQSFLPNSRADTLLALPADLPLVTVYDTQYDTYAAMNRLPYEHRTINQRLPKLLARIELAAKACQLNDQAVQQTSTGNAAAALLAIQQAATAQRQFIDSVVAYNQIIGDYSLKVAPWDTPANRLAGMLVIPAASINGPAAAVAGRPIAPLREATLPNDPRANDLRQPRAGTGGFNASFQQPVTAPVNGATSPANPPPPVRNFENPAAAPAGATGIQPALPEQQNSSDAFRRSGTTPPANDGAFQPPTQINPQPSATPPQGLPSSRFPDGNFSSPNPAKNPSSGGAEQ